MGNICSNEETEKSNTYVIRKMDTGSLDLENHNPLLDQLVIEKYKSKCATNINAKIKGYLFRKNFTQLKLLLKNNDKEKNSDSSNNLEEKQTKVKFNDLLPNDYSLYVHQVITLIWQDELFLSLYKDFLTNNNTACIYNKTSYYEGNLINMVKAGFGRLINFKKEHNITDKSSSENIRQISSDIKEINLGFFLKGSLVYGCRFFNPSEYYYGTFKVLDNNNSVPDDTGFYFLDINDPFKTEENNINKITYNYKGQFKNNYFTDQGVLDVQFTKKNRIKHINFTGEFVEGIVEGCGIFAVEMDNNNNLNIQEKKGENENIKSSSKSLHHHHTIKDIYQSNFKKSRMHDSTIITFHNNDKFTGNILSNKYSGEGVYRWDDKSIFKTVFEGEYDNNNKLQGIYLFVEKIKINKELVEGIIVYKGKFKNNLPEGEGIIYFTKTENLDEADFTKTFLMKDSAMILNAYFSKGRVSRVIKSIIPVDYQVLDIVLVSNIKKENVIDIEALQYLNIVGNVGNISFLTNNI